MKVLFDLHNSSYISTYQSTCKNHLWGRVSENPHGVIIKSNSEHYKKYGNELIYDIPTLVGTDEWWASIENYKIRTNEYIGILYQAGKCDLYNHITIHTVNDSLINSWYIEDWLPDYKDSIGKLIKITYAPFITQITETRTHHDQFIIKVEIE